MGTIERPSLESLVMDFAMSLTRRATCKRFQVGCVITSEDMTQIYGFGYNGTAKGLSHDDCKADQPGGCGCVQRGQRPHQSASERPPQGRLRDCSAVHHMREGDREFGRLQGVLSGHLPIG